jgi:hypothetical protein
MLAKKFSAIVSCSESLPEDINAKMRSISSGVNLSAVLPDMLLMPFLSVAVSKLKNSSNSAK